MIVVWLIFMAAVIFAVASFGFQNVQYLTLDYFGVHLVGVPLWLLVAVPGLIGILVGMLADAPGRVRREFTRRSVAKDSDARDRTSDALQLRVTELERDLAQARLASPAQIAPAGGVVGSGALGTAGD